MLRLFLQHLLDFIQKDGGVFFDALDFGVGIRTFGFIQKTGESVLNDFSEFVERQSGPLSYFLLSKY